MTEIGGQLRQALLDVVAAAVPMEQGPDGEAMAQIMEPWAVMIFRRPSSIRSTCSPTSVSPSIIWLQLALISL